MRLDWYFTDLPFLPFPSVINSLDWRDDPWEPHLLGEQYGQSRNYNGKERIEGLTGEHVCGDEADFANGQPWPYTGEPILYDDAGIPVCCGRSSPHEVTAGFVPEAITPPTYARTATVGISSADAHKVAIHRAPVAGFSADYILGTATVGRVSAGVVAEQGGHRSAVLVGARVDNGHSTAAVDAGMVVDFVLGPPNTSCPVAQDVVLDETFEGYVNVGGPCKWWKLPVLTPAFLEAQILSSLVMPTGGITFYSGSDCDHLTVENFSDIGGFDIIWFHMVTSAIWIRVCPTDKDVSFSIKIMFAPTP